MVRFFQVAERFDQIEIYDLLLERYGGGIEWLLSRSFGDFVKTIITAADERAREEARAQWVTMLPYMSMKMIDFVSFEDYFDRITGKNIDLRPASEILKEIDEIEKEFADGDF